MEELHIGRTPDNDLVLNDSSVSRHHCVVTQKSDKFFIKDLGSTNGTMVDNTLVEDVTEIFSTSVIKIGTYVINFEKIANAIQSKQRKNIVPELISKYEKMLEKYKNNIGIISKTMQLDNNNFNKRHISDTGRIEMFVRDYSHKINEVLPLLKLVSDASVKDNFIFEEDIKTLCSSSSNNDDVASSRAKLDNLYDEINRTVSQGILSAFKQVNDYYCEQFSDFCETAQFSNDWWTKHEDKNIAIPYCLLDTIEEEYKFFSQRIRISYWSFAECFRSKNVLVKYDVGSFSRACTYVNTILARILAGSRPGNVMIHMVDLKEFNGTSNMLKLLNPKVFQLYSRSDDVRQMFSELDSHVESVIANLLVGECNSIEEYNADKQNQEPYHLIVLKDFPYDLSTEIVYPLNRILNNGKRAGVNVIFLQNMMFCEGDDGGRVINMLQLDDVNLIDLTKKEEHRLELSNPTIKESIIHSVVQHVNSGLELKDTIDILKLSDYIIPDSEWWTKNSSNRMDIPYGLAQNKQTACLNITQESGQNCAVVIGIPGSGKSVFLHVLIANAVINYSPKELQLYLMDFSGVEFKVYADHKLPHARVIAPEAEREFGLSVLRELYAEGSRRMKICRDKGVTNIVELRKKCPDMEMPRLLVIVDEFQKIFEIENDKISQEANRIIHVIIQEYRKFGINLILATQKLPAKSIVPYDLIANRVVFKSDPNDFSNLIKWPSFNTTPRLTTGDCIYNNESGNSAANIVARAFFTDASADLPILLDKLIEFASLNEGKVSSNERTIIFDSETLPDFRKRSIMHTHKESSPMPDEVGIYLGEAISISSTDVYVPLRMESNNNILIIGGTKQDIPLKIAYYATLSQFAAHDIGTTDVYNFVFARRGDNIDDLFNDDLYDSLRDAYDIYTIYSEEDTVTGLNSIKDIIERRKSGEDSQFKHIYLNLFSFQRGHVFDMTGTRSDMQSKASRTLEYILKNGPSFGVFTLLQVDNIANMNKIGYSTLNNFNFRITLQMPETESNKIIGNVSANKLYVEGREASEYRALYYELQTGNTIKFKPYK